MVSSCLNSYTTPSTAMATTPPQTPTVQYMANNGTWATSFCPQFVAFNGLTAANGHHSGCCSSPYYPYNNNSLQNILELTPPPSVTSFMY